MEIRWFTAGNPVKDVLLVELKGQRYVKTRSHWQKFPNIALSPFPRLVLILKNQV